MDPKFNETWNTARRRRVIVFLVCKSFSFERIEKELFANLYAYQLATFPLIPFIILTAVSVVVCVPSPFELFRAHENYPGDSRSSL
jgi:hypothetical protein